MCLLKLIYKFAKKEEKQTQVSLHDFIKFYTMLTGMYSRRSLSINLDRSE